MFQRKTPAGSGEMAKESDNSKETRDNVISIIGLGMRVIGDCETDGTLRIEGTVEGTVRAAKAVVIGKDGIVKGDVLTQDAIIGGRVTGAVVAESRLELQATSVVDGEIRARRIKLDEGGRVNGTVYTGEVAKQQPGQMPARATAGAAD
jgi:cytoskeletal protein CcmA (bactofilin family)